MKIREASHRSGPVHASRGESARTAEAGVRSCQGKRAERGIALVITLIMLAVTLVMAVAFLAVARRETGGVDTQRDNKVAQLAAETAVARAQAQIAAGFLSSLTNGTSSNAYSIHLFVSTNFINAYGFNPAAGANVTNVSYYDHNGNALIGNSLVQNIANLYYVPRVPVLVATNTDPRTPLDSRFYLDLNQNGNFDANGWQAVISDDPAFPFYNTNQVPQRNELPGNVLSNFMVGDPEWVGVLAHPDEPHGPNNPFVSRYAFIALPAGNSLDINYIHNQALNDNFNAADGYMRNQGVGTWELNLAAFLADLNTNVWSPTPLPDNNFYAYHQVDENPSQNRGKAFQDAFSILRYRYNGASLPNALSSLRPGPPGGVNQVFPRNNVDNYSRGPLQTSLNYYRYFFPPPVDTGRTWSGADNPNHLFSLADLLDGTKTGSGLNSFTNDLRYGGTTNFTSGGVVLHPTYDAYTYYRLLDEMGADSLPETGKLNLNYSNAVVAKVGDVVTVNIIPGAETNLMRWTATNFFIAAADQMLRTYTAFWNNENRMAFTNTFGITDTSFGITNIPVWVSNKFVYTPSVNRLLQMAANMYDATTNNNLNLPHVYRPLFRHERHGTNDDIFVMGYIAVDSVSDVNDRQLAFPYDVTELAGTPVDTPIVGTGGVPINVWGVPWIIGAKKGLPNFNQLSLLTAATVSRKLEITRTSLIPKEATYTTNQAYIISVTNQISCTFWNSYTNKYPRSLRLVVLDRFNMGMTNRTHDFTQWPLRADHSPLDLTLDVTFDPKSTPWLGSVWDNQPAAALLNANECIKGFSWPVTYQQPFVYNDLNHSFTGGTFEPVLQLDQLGFVITNRFRAFILDGNSVIDYVQLRDPISIGGLNQALADPAYSQQSGIYFQWSTNVSKSSPSIPYGVANQLYISGHPPAPKGPTPENQMPVGGQWSTAQTPMGDVSPEGEAAFFSGFFVPNFQYNGKFYVNRELSIQAPYTPSRTVFCSYLLQANDPLVHYTASDMNGQPGTLAEWNAKQPHFNGFWEHIDDPVNQPLPMPPLSPVGGRYQPWGAVGQMAALGANVDANQYNLAYKDSMMFTSDFWDFPTNQYPTVGWLGRVHRGTPWQTIYLKSTNILANLGNAPNGTVTWADWTGNIQTNFYSYFFDTINSAPQQDFLLFDIFTTRYNDNSARGAVPVNVGMGRNDGGLAAWSALFSGMTALTNTSPAPLPLDRLGYTNYVINPAGIGTNSPLWKIVNGPWGINATRANTNLFPSRAFLHAGQVLATPALSVASPFLYTNTVAKHIVGQRDGVGSPGLYGINDEMYEWLPQQMMGLVRGTEQRYTLYCFGQTLRPAPGGTVLGGSYGGLVTNYQVTAESAIRAMIRVDNANTTSPRAVVESYNVLPPN